MKRVSLILVIVIICLPLFSCGKSEEATNVDNMILEIGEITLESGDKITNVEEAVRKLNEDDYKQLKYITTLEEARNSYNNLEIEDIKSAIDKIGLVTLEQELTIKSIRDRYDSANDEVKAGISNYQILEQAENDLNYLKEKALQEALSSLQIETDEVENITYYKPATYPNYANSRSFMLPYIAQQNSSASLVLRFYYTNRDWLFFDRITISIDGDTNYKKTYNTFEIHRDIGNLYIMEWVDDFASLSNIEILKQIVSSEKTVVRFEGMNYYDEIIIDNSDKSAINQVLTAYELLNN